MHNVEGRVTRRWLDLISSECSAQIHPCLQIQIQTSTHMNRLRLKLWLTAKLLIFIAVAQKVAESGRHFQSEFLVSIFRQCACVSEYLEATRVCVCGRSFVICNRFRGNPSKFFLLYFPRALHHNYPLNMPKRAKETMGKVSLRCNSVESTPPPLTTIEIIKLCRWAIENKFSIKRPSATRQLDTIALSQRYASRMQRCPKMQPCIRSNEDDAAHFVGCTNRN